MDDYRLVRMLGEGTYGRVYEARDKAALQTVAIKLVPLAWPRKDSSEEDSVADNRELQALQLCRHPNVVRLHGHFVHQHGQLALVLDYAACDLSQLLSLCQRTATPLPLPVIRLLARELLTAVAHCHALGVLHRDIKPHNILLAARAVPVGAEHTASHFNIAAAAGTVRLADFGQSRVDTNSDRPLSPAVSTRWYKAPELLLPSYDDAGVSYGCGVDVWAAACVLAECVSGAVLLPGAGDVEQLSRIAAMCGRQGSEQGWERVAQGSGAKEALSEAEEERSEQVEGEADAEVALRRDLLNLLDGMLQWEPTERLTAQQALDHPFFAGAALTPEQTEMDSLLRWYDEQKAEKSDPQVSTSQLLQQSLTVRHIMSCCAPASAAGTQPFHRTGNTATS